MDPMSELPHGMARALRALDERAAQRAAAVDPERVAQRVLKRLREEPSAEAPAEGWRAWSAPRAVRVAAAAVLFAIAGVATMVLVRGEPAVPAGTSALPVSMTVESLSGAQAEAVLKAMDEVRVVNGTAPRPSTVTVDQLSEPELRALLQAMQSSEGEI
jgi:hypothetical protein